ncbi:unnamed protein product [Lactuca saligna]|uniref:Uncharacterized protein n=1 Tax=Lactuca saligna TaxID=75948 RepID=A0AA35VWY4_LACSI|nr:unnamed protein product [Lactuca saligna]
MVSLFAETKGEVKKTATGDSSAHEQKSQSKANDNQKGNEASGSKEKGKLVDDDDEEEDEELKLKRKKRDQELDKNLQIAKEAEVAEKKLDFLITLKAFLFCSFDKIEKAPITDYNVNHSLFSFYLNHEKPLYQTWSSMKITTVEVIGPIET